MRDIVSSESSLFWKLTIPPTRFDGFFCESVTRQFESDPEPCSQEGHFWNCAFTENMINGVATIDIVIRRIEVKQKGSSSSPSLSSPSSPSDGHQQDKQEHSSLSHSQTQTQTQTHMQDQQEHDQIQRQQGHGHQQLLQTRDDRPTRIHYKTIALHTPKTMAPLMFMFLDGSSTGDTPIRVELEANAIRYRGNYVFEIVLSEDISSYMNPSPSSCHRVFDSLYHEIVATSHPDPSTTDVWFEFYPHPATASKAATAEASTQDRSSLPSMLLPVEQRRLRHVQEHPDGSDAVAVVGAHFEKLVKYPYFAAWIEREKRVQEEQRRIQLEEERRIHQEHHKHRRQQQQQQQPQQQQQQPQQQQQSQQYNPWWYLEPPHHLSESQVGGLEDQQRVTWIEEPSASRSSRYGDSQQHPQYSPHQRAEYHPREIPTYFQPLQFPLSSSLSSPSASALFPPHRQQHSPHVFPQHQHQQQHRSRSEPSHSQHIDRMVPPPPTLRIPVKGVSLGTFQAILQYIYTGSIGLSNRQINDVDRYWNDNPEDHLGPQQNRNPLDDEDMPSLSSLLAYYQARDRLGDSQRSGVGNSRIVPRPPIVLPVPGSLGVALGDQQQSQQAEGEEGERGGPVTASDRPYTSIKDIIMSDDIYTFTTASAQTAWIPCSPRDRRREFRDPQFLPSTHVGQQQPMSGQDEQSAVGSSRRQDQRRSEGEQANSSTSGLHSAGGPSASSSSTTGSIYPPSHQLYVHKTRPTCSWESLLLAANLFQLQDLETTAIKAIKYHCQMLTSRALINNNVMVEVAHDGFDRTNMDLQLVFGERILLSLLKLYRSPLLTIHSEGVLVLRGSQGGAGGGGSGGEGKRKGIGGGEGEGSSELKIQRHFHAGPAGLQSQQEERFRHEAEEQQGGGGGREGREKGQEKGKQSGNNDDDMQRQEEGHLGTARTASSFSSPSSAGTRGGSGREAASSRTRGSRRSSGQGGSSGAVAQQQQPAVQKHESETSSSTRTRTRTTSGGSSSSAKAAGYYQRQGFQGYGDDGGGEGQLQRSEELGIAGREEKENDEGEEREEGEEEREGGRGGSERVTTPLALLDHPECEMRFKDSVRSFGIGS